MNDTKETKESEVDTLVPVSELKISLVGGGNVSVPPLTWGKEIKVFQCLGKMMSQMPKMEIDPNNPGKILGGLDMATLIPKLIETVPEELTTLMVVILEKDKEWVETNLSAKEVLGFVVPFLQTELKELGTVLKPVVDSITNRKVQ